VSAASLARLERVQEIWRRVETTVIGCLVVAALIVFLYGSIMRTLAPQYAIDWAEEVAIYLIVWATLLSGGILASERDHVSAEILSRALSERANKRLRLGVELLMLAFCAMVAWLGAEAVLFADRLDERSASSLQAPQAWVLYLALPIGMVLIVVRILLLFALEKSRRQVGDDPEMG